MTKELRLNDKIWFGQYKGLTIRKIYQIDMPFLDRLISTGRFILAHNVTEYFEKSEKCTYKSPEAYTFDVEL